MDNRKYIILFLFVSLIICSADSGFAETTNFAKTKKAVPGTTTTQLKQQQKAYVVQKNSVNKKILSLQEAERKIDKILGNNKISEKQRQEEVKKKENIGVQIASLVVSLADLQKNIEDIDGKIKDFQEKEKISSSANVLKIPQEATENQVVAKPVAPLKKPAPVKKEPEVKPVQKQAAPSMTMNFAKIKKDESKTEKYAPKQKPVVLEEKPKITRPPKKPAPVKKEPEVKPVQKQAAPSMTMNFAKIKKDESKTEKYTPKQKPVIAERIPKQVKKEPEVKPAEKQISPGGAVNFAKAKNGVCEIIIDSLKQKRDAYIVQKKQMDKDISNLQKAEDDIDKLLDSDKISEAERQEQIKKKEDVSFQIASMVVSISDLENKIDVADVQIKEIQTRRNLIRSAVNSKMPDELVKRQSKNVVSASKKDQSETVEFIIAESDKAAKPKPGERASAVEDSLALEAGSEPELEKVEYKIAPHDELQINVYGEPDLAKTVRVASDGSISYPLIGRIKVDGLTVQELEEKLAKLLMDGGFIVNPQVGVYMERYSTISILGEVRNPGSYELRGKVGILDSIAQAGGFNIDADINNIKILRMVDGEKKTMQLKLGDIKKGIESAEITLRPNDTIFVEKIGKITVLGEVARPGTFELKDRTTILGAIAMAGGFTEVAAVNGTRIIREGIRGRKNVIRVNITDITYRGKIKKDMELLPGDIVYVPETLF